jgi:hypothetical protein
MKKFIETLGWAWIVCVMVASITFYGWFVLEVYRTEGVPFAALALGLVLHGGLMLSLAIAYPGWKMVRYGD